MKHRAIIFDLDGTLLDTLADLTDATNHVLSSRGRPGIGVQACRRMIGNGVRVLLQRAADLEGEELDRAQQQFLAYYHEHKYDHTLPFDGVTDTLDTLVARGLRLGILSNKPHPATVEMTGRLLGGWPFEQVFGQRDGVPLKPDPAVAIQITEAMGLPAEAFAFVGDSGEDMATASAAGMFAVGVSWGFRDEPELHEHGADMVVHTPGELLDVLR